MAHTRHKPGAFALVLTIFLGLFTTVHAHSCVERLMRIAYNGSMVGTPGFPRGYVDRNAPDIGNFDDKTIFRINPPIEASLLAHPSQRTFNYSQQFPRLTAAPGDLVALQYQDNGHVTFANGYGDALVRPENRGTVYIYGTADPISPDAKLLDIHYHWNVEGTGGDGKGKLLATRNFDDGQCYQKNDKKISLDRQKNFPKTVEPPGMGDLWCQSDLSLPGDLEVGKPYTLIWVWDWPEMNRNGVAISPVSPTGSTFPAPVGNDGTNITHPELYTTVMDINIVDPCDKELGTVKGPSCKTSTKIAYSLQETNLNKASVAKQCTNNFLVDVSGLFNGSSPSPSAPGSAPGPASSKSASASARPSDPAPAPGPASSKSASPSASPSVSASAPAHHPGSGRTKTVIETVPSTTVTVTVQPTEAAKTSSDASTTATSSDTSTTSTSSDVSTTSSDVSTTVTSSQSAQTTGSIAYGAKAPAVTAVTGFLKSSQVGAKKIRREAGHWTFGHG